MTTLDDFEDACLELADHLHELTDTDTPELVHFQADLDIPALGVFDIDLADGRQYRLTLTRREQ